MIMHKLCAHTAPVLNLQTDHEHAELERQHQAQLHELFSQRHPVVSPFSSPLLDSHCGACAASVPAVELVTALGRNWHRTHFCCSVCKKAFLSSQSDSMSSASSSAIPPWFAVQAAAGDALASSSSTSTAAVSQVLPYYLVNGHLFCIDHLPGAAGPCTICSRRDGGPRKVNALVYADHCTSAPRA